MSYTCLLKLILLIAGLTAGVRHSASAQEDSARFHLALHTGAGVSLTQKTDYLSGKGYEPTNLVTFLAGLSGVYKFNKFLSVGMDLYYNYRGTNYQKINDSLIYVTTNQSGAVQKTETVYFYTQNIIGSMDIPVYLKLGSYNRTYSPYLNLGFNSSFTLSQKQREYLWIGTKKNVQDSKIPGMAGRYYPGLLLAAGLKVKQFIVQVSYITYPNTKIFYFDFNEKVNTRSFVVSAAYIIFRD